MSDVDLTYERQGQAQLYARNHWIIYYFERGNIKESCTGSRAQDAILILHSLTTS
jgi:hypothetical protein